MKTSETSFLPPDKSTPFRLYSRTAILIAAFTASSSIGVADTEATKTQRVVVPVNPAYFITDALVGEIVQEERTLSDGTTALCYVIQTYSEPHEHEMGPWAPKTITDGKEAGGIWFFDGKVYDVDGDFVKNISALYNDSEWKLYRDDGTVRVTDTKEAFEAAARPDVDPRYNNYVVEGRAEWFGRHVFTYVIPVKPIYQERPSRLRRGGIGLAFNGVNYDPPAPLDAILEAHTIAPFDDAGGHINPHEGYHYHAATGKTKEVAQADGHAPMIGYALDGFGLFAHLDPASNAPTDLDACGGHYDDIRGYHYHAGSPASNQVISAFRGIPGSMKVAH